MRWGLLIGIGVFTTMLGGCPAGSTLVNDSDGPSGPVTADLAINVTQGPPPLSVVVFGDPSSSTAGAIVSYAWDFGDGTTATGREAAHVYSAPGLFDLQLTVTDSAGNTGTTVQEIRVAGDGVPTAVIQAEPESGPAPLVVQFDGTASSATDDTIRDYYWDFGDGETSRASAPLHIYSSQGDFTVTLRVVTVGGNEAETTKTIRVGTSGAALQFLPSQLATLQLRPADLSALTFEAWIKPENAGGQIASFTGDLTITVDPGAGTVSVTKGGETETASVGALTGVWSHLAVTYAASGTVEVYVDGQRRLVGSLPTGALSVTQLSLGPAYTGKIDHVALWSEIRTQSEIANDATREIDGDEAQLHGFWPILNNTRQQIRNEADPGFEGWLGSTNSAAADDASRSTDTPDR
jgi:PKD repeat protein